jgi:translation initiation factor eIF-6, putative
MERTVSFAGDPNIGVFARAFDDVVVVPPDSPEEFRTTLKKILKVEVLETTIQGSSIIGSLLAGNSRGFVVSGLVHDSELQLLEKYRDVYLLEHTMNAAGNVILANDHFAAVHPEMPADMAKEIGTFLGVPVHTLSLGGIKTIGMAAVATGRGILVNPRSNRQEIERLESASGLPVGTGSVNMGSGLVGAGLVANSHGYVAGLETTGYELGRIEDVFGFLE